jgi:hypothetical protein
VLRVPLTTLAEQPEPIRQWIGRRGNLNVFSVLANAPTSSSGGRNWSTSRSTAPRLGCGCGKSSSCGSLRRDRLDRPCWTGWAASSSPREKRNSVT